MNSSIKTNKTIIGSVLTENDDLVDYLYVYFVTTTSFIGFLLNLVCVVIFLRKELRKTGNLNDYLLCNTINAAFYVSINGFTGLTRCGSICSTANTYEAKAYELYGIFIFSNASFFFGTLIQLALSLNQILVIRKNFCLCSKFNSISSKLVCFVALLLSLLYSIPIFFSRYIHLSVRNITQKVGTNESEIIIGLSKKYSLPLSDLGSNDVFSIVMSVFYICCNDFVLIIVLIINIYLIKELKRCMNKKRLMLIYNNQINLNKQEHSSVDTNANINSTNSNKSNETNQQINETCNSMNKRKEKDMKNAEMRGFVQIIWLSLLFFSSRIIYTLLNIIQFFRINKTVFKYIGFTYFAWANLVHGSFFFVYFFSNKLFKKQTLEMIALKKRRHK
jgi:hypothetical protein